jgi:hypothetical protein
MAQVLGKSGRYVADQAVKKRQRILLSAIILVVVTGTAGGFLAGLFLNRHEFPIFPGIVFILIAVVVWVVAIFGVRWLERLEKERISMRKGAAGEVLVGARLADFPDEFYVINDLTTPFGNLDHVVVGPTGVFVIDAKNWRGVVASDGTGELLHNGEPTDKPMVRSFVGRLMGIKDQIRNLSRLDPYFQGVFAFTSARVDADWGTTRSVHCLRDDQLFDYIVEGKNRRKLSKQETESIAQAFLALARMDKGF